MEEQYITAERALMRAARLVSVLFTPFYIPLLAFVVLFSCSYLRIMPMGYKLIVLSVVGSFTILMPAIGIALFYRINHMDAVQMRERKKRYMPFFITIISYVFCLLLMRRLNIPWYMTGIILAALLVMLVCVVLNLRWKLSEHMAGAGAMIGGLVAFSALFGYNPVWWLCFFILVAGMLGSARITLQHHTPGEVTAGFLVGLGCTLLVLHPNSGFMLRIFPVLLFP